MLSPLALALPAMTALQATVALGVFALSVLAPQLGLSVLQLAGLNTMLFSVGAVGALFAGALLRWLGGWPLAALCAAAVALGMGCLLWGGPLAPWAAVLLFGIAFGPETPASAAVLAPLTPPARRPWVFSVRQTGNQIGAMAGSALLPGLLAAHPRAPYFAVALLALAMAAWCLLLARSARLRPAAAMPGMPGAVPTSDTPATPAAAATPETPATPATPATPDRPVAKVAKVAAVATVAPVAPGTAGAGSGSAAPAPPALRQVLGSRPLQALAFAALCYTAAQMCLNTFLMSLAVREWHFGVGQAAAWVAGLQAAGLGGRLFWGWLAQRSESASRLLGGLGLLIAGAGIALMGLPAAHQGAALAWLVALLGFSASGWNGVLVAEVSRIAGAAGAGALTGAVLVFGYAGLALAPLAFAAASSAASMAVAFIGVFAAAGLAGAALLWVAPAPAR